MQAASNTWRHRRPACEDREKADKPACEKTRYLGKEQRKHRQRGDNGELAADWQERRVRCQHIEQQGGVAIVNAKTVDAGIGMKALGVGRAQRKNKKWNKDRKCDLSALLVDVGKNDRHQRCGRNQHGPLCDQA